MSTARARDMLFDLVEAERAPTDMDALRAIAGRARVSVWPLHNLHRGRAKSVKDGIMARLNDAYLDLCRRQLARWEHQLTIAEATSDDAFDDLRQALSDMEARLATARNAAAADRGRHGSVPAADRPLTQPSARRT